MARSAAGPRAALPFSFSTREQQDIIADFGDWKKALETMERVRDTVGPLFPEDGAISTELYDEALRALTQVRDAIIREFATNEKEKDIWMKEWPFGT
jgi:hypothetical protein